MKQESHSSSSSSSSPSSHTVGEIPVREREDATNSDISPVPVSELVDDRSGRFDETQANKNPKTNKKETAIEWGDPLCSNDSEIPEWLQEFRENLVDDEIPLQGGSHASFSHEASLEPTIKRREDLGKHNVHTHFLEVKIHLDNARKLRRIYFIDPEDKEFKETIKNARKKLETSVALAMPCKIMKNCGSGASNKIKTKFACILEANESTRMRMGNSEPSNHEDHIAGKGENSLQHYNLVHKFIPMPQAMKILAAKAAVDKEWEKLEKISAWNLTKVKSKKQVIDEARMSGATVHFASLMDICHLKNAELEAKHQKIQRSSCSPR